MSMTKKDFKTLADAIRAHNAKHPRIGYNAPGAAGVWGAPFNRSHLETLADFCAGQNPNFDRARFMAYIKEEVTK